ncbi:MAG TPA: HAD-IIA family hydrolase [Metalysinibacillus sp.]
MQYKAYCFDLDGTVYRGNEPIASAVTFIHALQAKGIEPFFITNNSSKTVGELQATLRDMDIIAQADHIYSSALATAKYITENFEDERVLLIGSHGLQDALQRAGVEIVEQGGSIVVVGIDREVNYMKLAAAAIAVQHGATLLSTNQDVKFPTEFGFVPGNGAFTSLIANVAGVEPIYIGKPSPLMLEMISRDHHLQKQDMVLIGDNHDTDIMCGVTYGIATIHVDTGVTRSADAIHATHRVALLTDLL